MQCFDVGGGTPGPGRAASEKELPSAGMKSCEQKMQYGILVSLSSAIGILYLVEAFVGSWNALLACALLSFLCWRCVGGVSFDGTSRQFEEEGVAGPPGALPALNKYDHFFKEFEGVDKFVRLSGNIMFCKEVESVFANSTPHERVHLIKTTLVPAHMCINKRGRGRGQTILRMLRYEIQSKHMADLYS